MDDTARTLLIAALGGAALMAGCLGLGANETPDELGPSGTLDAGSGPHATVALIDTGINPYHEVFHVDDPLREQHPSTYIDGYPEDAKALEVTTDADSWAEAVQADCEDVWSEIEEGQLYWVPGTKIVGAVAVGSGDALDCGEDPQNASVSRILDLGGHGTMVASRAAAEDYGACPSCSIVAVHGFNEDAVAWAAENSAWIDVQSNSWGPTVPLWVPDEASEPAGNAASDPSFVRTVEEAAQEHVAFWASGNGAMTRGGLVGHPTTLDPRMTPSIIMVGGHDSGYINTWPGFPPDVVANSCNGWAAHHDSLDESDDTVAGGTSGATPYAAGKTAAVLLHARTVLDDAGTGIVDGVAASGTAPEGLEGPLDDGEFTDEEIERVMKTTADTRPQGEEEDGPRCDEASGLVLYSSTPVRWEDVPEGYPEYVHIGYGAITGESTEHAKRVLDGDEPLPDREDADRFFEGDDEARQALYELWSS